VNGASSARRFVAGVFLFSGTTVGERRPGDRWIPGASALLLGATTVQWALWEWVS
jgi:hypothetical protein